MLQCAASHFLGTFQLFPCWAASFRVQAAADCVDYALVHSGCLFCNEIVCSCSPLYLAVLVHAAMPSEALQSISVLCCYSPDQVAAELGKMETSYDLTLRHFAGSNPSASGKHCHIELRAHTLHCVRTQEYTPKAPQE
jgi:hypothetical protein